MLGHQRRRAIRAFFEESRPWILGFLGVVALGFLYYFLATLGPRSIKSGAPKARAPDDPVVRRIATSADEAETAFRKALEKSRPDAEIDASLAVAIERQRELANASKNVDPLVAAKLTQLESELGSRQAKGTIIEIERLEREAGVEAAAGHETEAQERYSEALRLQRLVNSSAASPRFKNYVRENTFVGAIEALSVAPLHREVGAAVEAAHRAAEERRWSDALAAYRLARDTQLRINREAARTRYADVAAIDRLESEIASLNAGEIVNDIELKEKEGDAAMVAGDAEAAARAYGQAHLAQSEINRKFTRSRFVSVERLDHLEVKRQTAVSVPYIESLRALDATIGGHLRQRRVVAAEQAIAEAMALSERAFSTCPRSPRLDPALRKKISFLSLRRAELRRLQDDVYDRLLPLPAASDRLLLRTEAPQALYALVMNTNPSRNPGRQLPVDSVSWQDAQEFCTRLSWLLGTVVRLPTADEYRVAASDGGAGAWTADNSAGRSHDVAKLDANSLGFHDLAGNVAEWLAGADESTALVAGGSYLDPAEAVSRLVLVGREKTERARHVGFRFLVELPETDPLGTDRGNATVNVGP